MQECGAWVLPKDTTKQIKQEKLEFQHPVRTTHYYNSTGHPNSSKYVLRIFLEYLFLTFIISYFLFYYFLFYFVLYLTFGPH